MSRIETPQQAMDFLNAGPDEVDTAEFWDALDVSYDAIVAVCFAASNMHNIPCPAVMTCLLAGARLAMRADLSVAEGEGEENDVSVG